MSGRIHQWSSQIQDFSLLWDFFFFIFYSGGAGLSPARACRSAPPPTRRARARARSPPGIILKPVMLENVLRQFVLCWCTLSLWALKNSISWVTCHFVCFVFWGHRKGLNHLSSIKWLLISFFPSKYDHLTCFITVNQCSWSPFGNPLAGVGLEA